MECKNCKSSLRDVDGFCSNCGARIIDERISFRFLFKEFLDKVLSVDNKLLNTFLHLFTKPEVVIDGFIKGVRKKYYNPVSYLLVSITLSGIYLYFLKDVALETLGVSSGSGSGNPFESPEFTKQFIDIFSDYQALFSVANIPIYGFVSWLVFLNKKKYNFYEHLIIYLYAASQIAILSFIVVVPIYFIDKEVSAIASLVMSAATFIYFGYVLIRLFKLTFFQFIIKTIYFSLISGFLFVIFSIATTVAIIFYMGPDYFNQFQPQNRNDSIQKIEQVDSIQLFKKNDSIKTLVLD